MKKVILFILLCCFLAGGVIAGENDIEATLSDDSLLEEMLVDEFADELMAEEEMPIISDPLEPLNRVFFTFNDRLYFWVLKPVKTGYAYAVPTPIRGCVSNFFKNLGAPIRLVNTLLQGRFKDAGIVTARFLINSTAGVLGLVDVADAEFDLTYRRADFGQTLGFYGLGEGIYLCWPVLGPSTVRNTVGKVGDAFANPTFHMDLELAETGAIHSVNMVNTLSLTPGIYEDLKKYSLDPYITARQSFFDYRRNIVRKASGENLGY